MCSLRGASVRPVASLALGAALVVLAPPGRADSPAPPPPRALESVLAADAVELPHGVARRHLRAFYAGRDYAPVWLAPDTPRAHALVARLSTAAREGLRPGDYRPAALRADLAGLRGAEARARLEARLSAQFLHDAQALARGRGRPGESLAGAPAAGTEATDALADLAASDAPETVFDRLPPANPVYRRLRRALADLRAIVKAGGWPRVTGTRTVERGMTGPQVAQIRARLRASGDLTIASDAPATYDAWSKIQLKGCFTVQHLALARRPTP
jgi:murein L,D-transpeptidase YcbB/YkuD